MRLCQRASPSCSGRAATLCCWAPCPAIGANVWWMLWFWMPQRAFRLSLPNIISPHPTTKSKSKHGWPKANKAQWPWEASKGIPRVSTRCYVIFSSDAAKWTTHSSGARAAVASCPIAYKHNIAAQGFQTTRAPTEHPFSSRGPPLGSLSSYHLDMPSQKPPISSVSSLSCSSVLLR